MIDGLVHGFIALLVTSPIIVGAGNWERAVGTSTLVFCAGTLIDLDHFVAARSLALADILNLDVRPPTHSLTFAAAAGLFTLGAFHSPALAWGAFAAMSSHVLRDASGGITSLFWPLSLRAIPRWAYYLGEIALFLASCLIVISVGKGN